MNMKRYGIPLVTILMLLWLGSPVAVTEGAMPGIGDAVTQTVPVPPETTPEPPETETPLVVEEPPTPETAVDERRIMIRDFSVEGGGEENLAEIAPLLAPYRNRALTMAQITEVANAITLFYRDRGYLVAKAYVPRQDAGDGILTVEVMLGEYGDFAIKNISPVKDSLLQRVFDHTRKISPVVTRESLERSMLLVGEMPGAKLPLVSIAPGQTTGTSDMVVSVDASPRITGYLLADNQGSEHTGEHRFYGGLSINSPMGIADKLSLTGMTTDETGLANGRIAYAFPLMANGLRAELAGSHTTYELGGVYSVLEATGTADVTEGTLSYPLQRQNDRMIDLSLNLAYKELSDDMAAVGTTNPRDILVGTLGVKRQAAGSVFGHRLLTVMTGSVNLGTLDIRDPDLAALNEAGADTAGTFSKLKIAVTGSLALTPTLSLTGSLSLQKTLTHKNLDATEQMFISGMGGVRAYTESVSFDNGYVATVEMRYVLPEIRGVAHSLGVFAENGWVYAENDDYTDDDSIVVSDTGLAYHVGFSKYFGTVQVAQPLGRTCVEDPGTRVLAQVGMNF